LPHFALVTTDGDSLGPIELGRADSPAGSVIYRGRDEANLRVVDVIPNDEPEAFTVLVVAPV
jgi:hypothetical protein